MQEQIHIETLINEVEELYQRLLDDRYALGEGRYAQMVTKGHRERLRAYQQRYYMSTIKSRRQPPQPQPASQPATQQPPSSTARSFTLFSRG
jgi:hypothetical protein